jgi:hypothetical protein
MLRIAHEPNSVGIVAILTRVYRKVRGRFNCYPKRCVRCLGIGYEYLKLRVGGSSIAVVDERNSVFTDGYADSLNVRRLSAG